MAARGREKWVLLFSHDLGKELRPSLPSRNIHQLLNSSMSHLTLPSSIPSYFCSATSSGTMWEHKLLCPKRSQPLNFPAAPRMLRDGWNSLGKPSALPPAIQSSLSHKFLLFTEEIHVQIRPGGQEFQRLEVPQLPGTGSALVPASPECSL